MNDIFKNFFISLYKNHTTNEYLIDTEKFKEKWNTYKIIPFGDYCLPRVITTINGLKPSRQYGEESFPFDLCFSKFENNLELFCNKFDGFYDDIKYNQHEIFKNCWHNPKTNMIFNHDPMLGFEEFKQRYNNRIKNLYNALKDQNKHLYFLVVTFSCIKEKQLKIFLKEIKKYRKSNSFSIIIINQSNKRRKYWNKNIYCINLCKDKSFKEINKNGYWAEKLKEMQDINAIIFNYKIIKKLSKILKSHCFHFHFFTRHNKLLS